MKPWNGTQIIKPVVDSGISQWTTMAEDWETQSERLIAAVVEALAAAPWGGGAEGEAFRNSHLQGDGPNRMLNQCVDLSRQITDACGRLRASIDNTLGTDADIESDLKAREAKAREARA
ncbi:hypothetical protein ACFFV7_35475 [Nonomuraea spiralis]|uniref:WXG100 family type VII secretion target n=1 Tax=Nonomuraea spiralis TaxID=46182 RepID=A0ABV5IRB9_9ACTN|nr:hypothetical protein [Nonomuraea spiralis]GGT32157.1 hypothetical protein GCM10010176_090980 [Nonomuraea spiralis]